METRIRRDRIPDNFIIAYTLYDILFRWSRQEVRLAERRVKAKKKMINPVPENPAAGYHLSWRRDA